MVLSPLLSCTPAEVTSDTSLSNDLSILHSSSTSSGMYVIISSISAILRYMGHPSSILRLGIRSKFVKFCNSGNGILPRSPIGPEYNVIGNSSTDGISVMCTYSGIQSMRMYSGRSLDHPVKIASVPQLYDGVYQTA